MKRKIISFKDEIGYQDGSVVSKMISVSKGGNVTLFAFLSFVTTIINFTLKMQKTAFFKKLFSYFGKLTPNYYVMPSRVFDHFTFGIFILFRCSKTECC